MGFQSTLPAWGETDCVIKAVHDIRISIHSPRMGRDKTEPATFAVCGISIHSPRMGRDPVTAEAAVTPAISIHSPRMGRDWKKPAPK